MNKIVVLNLSSFFDSSTIEKQVAIWSFWLLKDRLGTLALLQNLTELKMKSLTDSTHSNVRAGDNTICISLPCMSKVYSFL